PAAAKPAKEDIWVYLSSVGDLLYGASGESLKLGANWNTKYPRGNSRSIFAIDRTTGRPRWVRNVEAMVSSFAIDGGRLYYCDPAYGLHALDAATGQEVWVNKQTGFTETTDIVKGVYHDGKYWVLFHPTSGRYIDLARSGDRKKIGGFFSDATRNSRRLAAFDVRDGRRLFTCEIPGAVAGVSFVGKTAFTGAQHQGQGGVTAVDTGTGQVKWRSPKLGQNCSPALATPNTVLVRSGVARMLDYRRYTQTGKRADLRWTSLTTIRPTCALAALPANGMLFVPGPGCFCPTPLRGNLGLSPGRPAAPDRAERLVKGPAYGKAVDGRDDTGAWATWRGVDERPDQFLADTMWSSGPLSSAHHALQNDCQACHVDAFVTVTDKTCLTCHEEDAHDHAAKPRLLTARGAPEGFGKIGAAFSSAFNKPPGRCVECHSEHEGAGA
ncbi:hypothetical protein LCGC14_2689660, partial [marine sediment metagenome]